jgi:hypothetical protein
MRLCDELKVTNEGGLVCMCGGSGLGALCLSPERMQSHAVFAAAQEYIISRRLFEGLPADEKKYWHSHHYEVP